MQRRAVVAGAGIGGLAVGRVLREAGFEVEILERAPDLIPSGAGISLWSNASIVLEKLGVMKDLPAGRSYPESGLRRWDGRVIVIKDLTQVANRYDAPMLFLQRTTLHNALLGGGIRELVRTGTEVVGARETGSKVEVELHDGEKLEADLLIGADGVRSRVRASLLNDGPPRFNGLLAYRALTDMPPFEFHAGEYWGPGYVFGLVHVDEDRLFWLATKPSSSEDPPEEDPIAGLLERHRDWAPAIPKIIEETKPEEVMRHALYDRKPTKHWVGRRVALLGDAAHPMLPFLGQGACQALEDAEALGQALRMTTDIQSALRAYQEQRAGHAAFVTQASRRIAKVAHLRAAPARALRDRLAMLVPERFELRQLDEILAID